MLPDTAVEIEAEGRPRRYEIEFEEGYVPSQNKMGVNVNTTKPEPPAGIEEFPKWITDGEVILYVDGEEQNRQPWLDRGSFVSLKSDGDLTPGRHRLTMRVISQEWGIDESVSTRFTADPQIFPDRVGVECVTPVSSATVGESVPLRARLSNDNWGPAEAEVTFSFGDTAETVAESVPRKGEASVEVVFEPTEDGRYQPEISYTVTNAP